MRSWVRLSFFEGFGTPKKEIHLGELEQQAVTHTCYAPPGHDDDVMEVGERLDWLELDYGALQDQQQGSPP